MALTRRQLTALGLEPEKIDEIISAHAETVSALKEEIEKQKEEAGKVPGLTKELADLKESIKGKDYDALKAEYDQFKADKQKELDDYKAEVAAKEIRTAKEKAYRAALRDANLSDKGVEKAIKYADWDGVELDENGGLKNAKDTVKSAREEWAEYIVKSEPQGAKTPTPPANNGGGTAMTKTEIMKIKNAAERQKAIAENPELFGLQKEE